MDASSEKTRIGFNGKTYIGKRKEAAGSEFVRIRVDSAVKLLRARDGWKVKRTRDYQGVEGCVRRTGEQYRELTEDDVDRIAEKTQAYRYRADVYPDEAKLEIWNNALGTWELKHSSLGEHGGVQ